MPLIYLNYCPFCSNEAKFKHIVIPVDKHVYFVECTACSARTSKEPTERQAANRWNTRAQTLDECAAVQKIKNERNAGRRKKISEMNEGTLIAMRTNCNKSIRFLAEHFDVSVGTVHKLISEHDKKSRCS